MSHHPDLLALRIDLTRQLLAAAVTERDRYADTPAWNRRARRRRAAADRAVTELRTRLADLQANNRPVYAVIVRADGRHHPLHEPVTASELHLIVGDTLDVAAGRLPAHPDIGLVIYVDDLGHHRDLPHNMTATALYGTGWPILGDVVVTTDNNHPFPDDLVDRLLPRRPSSGRTHRGAPAPQAPPPAPEIPS